MRAALAIPLYRQFVAACGDEQQLLLGYSDSTKDGGYATPTGSCSAPTANSFVSVAKRACAC